MIGRRVSEPLFKELELYTEISFLPHLRESYPLALFMSRIPEFMHCFALRKLVFVVVLSIYHFQLPRLYPDRAVRGG